MPADQPLPKVSEKSKKDEIFSAYQQLIKKFEDTQERSSHIARSEEDTLMNKAASFSVEEIMQNVAKLDADMRGKFSELAEALMREVKKLHDVEQALAVAQKRLENVHTIHAEADTFARIVEEHREKKRQLVEEFERQKEEMMRMVSDTKEEWRREQEEFEYELKLKRKKEEGEYQLQKEAKERVLKEREALVVQQKQELEELRTFKADAEKKMQDGIERAQHEATEKTKSEYEVKATIIAEKNAAQERIAALTVESLKNRLKEYEQEIIHLKKELDIANNGVKEVAMKVIEGVGRMNDQHRALKAHDAEKSHEMKSAA